MDHIKALSAIQDANLDLHMNLKTHLPDGRLILTYIRPGKENGRLLSLTEDLPWTHDNPEEYLPLLRAQVFTSKDEELSLSMFVYGETEAAPESVKNIGTHITEFARDLQDGYFLDDKSVCRPSKLFESEKLLEYFDKCSESYIVRSNPRRFLRQRELYEQVSGTEGMAISIDVSFISFLSFILNLAHHQIS
jgi:glutamate dehydrogenase